MGVIGDTQIMNNVKTKCNITKANNDNIYSLVEKRKIEERNLCLVENIKGLTKNNNCKRGKNLNVILLFGQKPTIATIIYHFNLSQ